MKKLIKSLSFLVLLIWTSPSVHAQINVDTTMFTMNVGLNGALMMVAPDPQALAMAATTPGPNGLLDGAKMIPFGGDVEASMDPGSIFRPDFNQTGVPNAFGFGVGPFLPPMGATGMEPQTAPAGEGVQQDEIRQSFNKNIAVAGFSQNIQSAMIVNPTTGGAQTWHSIEQRVAMIDNMNDPDAASSEQFFRNAMVTDGTGVAAGITQLIQEGTPEGGFSSCFNCDLTLSVPSVLQGTIAVSDFMGGALPNP
ncbi:MAG TPA: hypothetical protein VI382_09045 [Candidatus Manganitrophaceae bacterium]|nr:hypothetical protein [Candidatus Manganitrophaceae bacterium]